MSAFGDIVKVEVAGRFERLRLIVSGEFYNALNEQDVITVDVNPHDDIPLSLMVFDCGEYGRAELDRLTLTARERIKESIGSIPREQHDALRDGLARLFV